MAETLGNRAALWAESRHRPWSGFKPVVETAKRMSPPVMEMTDLRTPKSRVSAPIRCALFRSRPAQSIKNGRDGSSFTGFADAEASLEAQWLAKPVSGTAGKHWAFGINRPRRISCCGQIVMKKQAATKMNEPKGSLQSFNQGQGQDRVLFVCNDAAYFAAHRASVADDLIAQGVDVHLCAGGDGTRPGNLNQDIVFHPLRLERHTFSLRSDLDFMRSVRRLTASLQPAAVHLITIKPNLFGGIALAARGSKFRAVTPRIVMTFPGLGKVFEENGSAFGRLRQWLTAKALRWVAAAIDAQATFENEENRNHLIALGAFPAGSTHVTFGTGIDLLRFERPVAPRTGPLTFVFASRLLNAKGVASFIAAAASRKAGGSSSRFIVAGGQDGSNPDNFDLDRLHDAHNNGTLEFRGQLDLAGIARLLQETDVVCLPTELNEGLPRILLEGASCGCAAIASDQPTIARLVVDGATGRLIDPKSPSALVEAIRAMEADPVKTRQMGKSMGELIRTLPVTEDSVNSVFLKLYGLTRIEAVGADE